MALGGALKSVFTRFTFGIDGGKLAAVNRTTGQAVTNMSFAAKQANALKDRMGGFLTNLKGMIALAVGGAALNSITVGFARTADEVGRMSESLGVSTEFFTSLKFAIESVGIAGDETSQIIADVSERMFDAANGSKALADDFGQIGLGKKQLKDLADKGPEAQFLALADAMQKTGPSAKRTFAAMSGLGDMGKRLLPLLNLGSEGFKKMAAEAKRLGVVLDKDAIESARKFNKRMILMKARLRGVRNSIALKLLPALNTAIDRFIKWTSEGNNATKMLHALGVMAAVAGAIIAKIVAVFVIAQWRSFVVVIKSAVTWFRALNAQMLLAQLKILAIAGGIIFLAAIIEDLVFFAQGERSLTGRLFGQDKDILAGLQLIKTEFIAVIETLSKSFEALWESIVMLGAAFGIKLTTIGALAKKVGKILFKGVLFIVIGIGFALSRVVRWLSIIIGLVARLAAFIVDVLAGAVRGLIGVFEDFWGSMQAMFDGIELAGLKVANTLKAAFEAAARFATKAWAGFKTFLGTIKDKVVSLGGRAKNFLLGRNTEVTGGISPGAAIPRPGAGGAPVTVTANTTVNANGLDEAAAKRVATAAAERSMRTAINGTIRDLKPSPTAPTGGVGIPTLVTP